jgi:pyrophosphate--fructose-6-phosphate 1-phosphotransferase
MASVRNTAAPSAGWTAGGIPLTMMMNLERRHGENRPVIRKALVALDGKPFQTLATGRARWAVANEYLYPGPIQYFGPPEVCDRTSLTLSLERG